MGQGRSDEILGVIWIIGSSGSRYFLKEDNSKSYGWIWMKFSLNV